MLRSRSIVLALATSLCLATSANAITLYSGVFDDAPIIESDSNLTLISNTDPVYTTTWGDYPTLYGSLLSLGGLYLPLSGVKVQLATISWNSISIVNFDWPDRDPALVPEPSGALLFAVGLLLTQRPLRRRLRAS